MKSKQLRLKTKTKPFLFQKKLTNLTKKNFEIVIARYDEDITWSDNYKSFRTIYNKGCDDIEKPYIKLKNIGHLADTILRHIITNYDNLADVTFFTHGSFNYRSDQLIKENGKCHKYFKDFICTDKNTLVYLENGRPPHKNTTFYNYPDTIGNIYKKIFNSEYCNNFSWCRGKIMSIGKNRIRKTSVEIYQKMLDFIHEPYEGKEPSQHIYRTRGIFIERLIIKCFI